jgi:hypothetical protein
MNGIVVGVDVSVRRGLDAVVLDDGLHIIDARAQLDPDGLRTLLERWRPETVAIDSPPGIGQVPGASSRVCEQRLRDLGVNIFLTPSDPVLFAKPFYQWIRIGEKAFQAAAEVGYAAQDDPAVVRGRALEVFPHASDVFLRGYLPAPGTTRRVRSKRAWRLATLRDAGIASENLCVNRVGQPTLDSIDAALAAVTAHHALVGTFSVFGEPGEWIVVPGTTVPARFIRSE